jgi:7-cyano-7-deazaguanine tRNA-ribosyltransferase
MVFELRDRDMLGRIGKLKTKSGFIETPILLPVINPVKMTISTEKLKNEFNCGAIITNAYILKKNFENELLDKGLHNFLKFKGPIMTDSGAYQLLVYGDIDINSDEIIRFQENIDSDIAVFLDVPTGGNLNYSHARYSVLETIRRARESVKIRSKKEILWVGPIQGGGYSDLVEESAKEMAALPFDIYAIGSPTQFLEQYNYDKIVNMIMISKKNLPLNKPIHLFGAGHPMFFSLAIALGCDIFDSAAYALYAEADRYITPYGTKHLNDLHDKICLCPICSKFTPKELKQLEKSKRVEKLAEHNLYVSLNEINEIKLAIREGRLWEYLERKVRSHTKLYTAFKLLSKYKNDLETGTPTTKKRALMFLSEESINRPEIFRHFNKLNKLKIPEDPQILVILPEPRKKPFRTSSQNKKILNKIFEKEKCVKETQIVTISKSFGLVPIELEDVYPLSQHLGLPFSFNHQLDIILNSVKEFLNTHNFKKIIFLNDSDQYYNEIIEHLKEFTKQKKILLKLIHRKEFDVGLL